MIGRSEQVTALILGPPALMGWSHLLCMAGHRVIMRNDPGRMYAIRDGNRKLFAGADARACFLTTGPANGC
jgi:hypothetical protein